MKFISDIAGHARLRGYSLQRASAMVRVAALTLAACASAGRRACKPAELMHRCENRGVIQPGGKACSI